MPGKTPGKPPKYQSDDERPVTVSLRIPRDLYEQAQRYVRMRHPMTLTDLLLDGLRLRLETPATPRDIILSDDNTVIQELQEMIQAAVQAEIGKLSDFLGPHFSTRGGTPTPEAPAESIPVPDIAQYDNTVLQKSERVETPALPSMQRRPEVLQAESADIGPTSMIPYNSNTVLQLYVDALPAAQEQGPDAIPSSVTEAATPSIPQRKPGRKSGPIRQQILTLLAEHPEGLSPEQVRGYLAPGRSIKNVLQSMRRAGVVQLRGEGYQKRYFVA